MNDWNGRHILIVGASEGIGRETAMLCARRGARLSLVARYDSVKKWQLDWIRRDIKDFASMWQQ